MGKATTNSSQTGAQAWAPRALTAEEQELAKALFRREIALITDGSFDDVGGERRRVRAWMARTGRPAPEDTWIGVVDAGRVVAALHASPHYGQASDVLAGLGQPGWGTPDWLRTYVEEVVSLEEVAVDATLRRQGAGAVVVRASMLALAHQGARTVSGFATNSASRALFGSLNFTIGDFREPVPRAFAGGLLTMWWDLAPDDGRYFWKKLHTAGASFGVRQ